MSAGEFRATSPLGAWSVQQPDWITDTVGSASTLLSWAWLNTTGHLSDEAYCGLVGADFAATHLAELVRDAELFDTDPDAAVDAWNTNMRDCVQYEQAGEYRDQLRSDAVAIAEQIATAANAAITPRLKAV